MPMTDELPERAAFRKKYFEPVVYAIFIAVVLELCLAAGFGLWPSSFYTFRPLLFLVVFGGALISASVARSLILRAILETFLIPALYIVALQPPGIFATVTWMLYPAGVFVPLVTTFGYPVWTNALYFIVFRRSAVLGDWTRD